MRRWPRWVRGPLQLVLVGAVALVVVALATGRWTMPDWVVEQESSSARPTPTVTQTPSLTTAPPEPQESRDCTAASTDGIPQQPGALAPLPSAADAFAALPTLTVAPRSHGDSYCRGRFGPDDWPDLDGNGCTTRQDVLVRSARQVTTRPIAAHGNTCQEAISGTWVDAYTGTTLTFTNLKDSRQAAQIQIDHLVPLYNAWVSGAWAWTDRQRVTFAQDLDAPELYAVAGTVNFAKNHAGVETWSPVPDRRCDYARSWVAVKSKYSLTVTSAEQAALTTMLQACG
ncbi:DUF1524 domain-containing protein [Lapillicoccus sp.]|uniref:GmrSD restriction endonuclease domain-containing protein n=1 Tax=Lapillicoccus sp. TaxID=1909287 RepID=UPI0032662D2F